MIRRETFEENSHIYIQANILRKDIFYEPYIVSQYGVSKAHPWNG